MFDDDEFQRDPSLTPAQHEFEGALRGLSPAVPAAVSRERLLFKAGVVVGRRSVNRWRGVAAVLVLGNAMWMAVSLRPNGGANDLVRNDPSTFPSQPATTPNAATQQPPVFMASAWSPLPLPLQPPAPASLSAGSVSNPAYPSMRDAVLRQGLSGLPPVRAARSRPRAVAEPLDVEQLLGGPEGASKQDDQQSQQPPPASPWAPLRRLFYGEHL